MNKFSVTYVRVTDESAACGDVAERGVLLEGASLRDCIPYLAHGFSDPRSAGQAEPDSSHGRPRSLTFDDYLLPWETEDGSWESRTLHIPDTVTEASAKRIARLFRVVII